MAQSISDIADELHVSWLERFIVGCPVKLGSFLPRISPIEETVLDRCYLDAEAQIERYRKLVASGLRHGGIPEDQKKNADQHPCDRVMLYTAMVRVYVCRART